MALPVQGQTLQATTGKLPLGPTLLRLGAGATCHHPVGSQSSVAPSLPFLRSPSPPSPPLLSHSHVSPPLQAGGLRREKARVQRLPAGGYGVAQTGRKTTQRKVKSFTVLALGRGQVGLARPEFGWTAGTGEEPVVLSTRVSRVEGKRRGFSPLCLGEAVGFSYLKWGFRLKMGRDRLYSDVVILNRKRKFPGPGWNLKLQVADSG